MKPAVTTSGQPLAHAPFSQTPRHIPDAYGQPYKTELVEERTAERTIKWNWWHKADIDRGGEMGSYPHDHPWEFESTIISGGYTEVRYWVENGIVKRQQFSYKAGDVNRLPLGVFHLVTAILPNTVSRMVCGKAREGNPWGYLNPETGEYLPAKNDPEFMEKLWALNPFLKEKKS